MKHPIPDAALDSDIAILGRKGGGKTFTSKGIVERLLDMKRRVLVLDPLGVWAGLRTSADGESAGYAVAIFGGEHADLPLDPAAAEPLARIIAGENLPAVIDLSDLSKTAQQAFLLKFLHELRRVNRDALTIVLEEADVFAPQSPQGDDSKMLHAEIDWISRRGRFRGFRLISICQRPARISKDVLTQANMLIMHRLPAPQDRDAAKAWVDGNGDRDQSKVVFDTLSGLAVGEAWVLAQEPAMLERVKFPMIKTLDTSATPKAGERRVEPKTLAQVDVSAISEALKASSDAAKAHSKRSDAPSEGQIAAAAQRAYHRGWEEGFREGKSVGGRSAAHNQMTRVIDALVGAAMINGDSDAIEAALGRMKEIKIEGNRTDEGVEITSSEVKVDGKVIAKLSAVPMKASAGSEPFPDNVLSPSARKIVDAVRSAYPVGISLVVAAKRAGLSSRSSAYRKHMQDAAGCPEIVAREDGRYVAAVPPNGVAPPPGTAAFKAKLPPSYAKMLEAVENFRGRPIDRETIAQQAGVSPTSSGLGAGLRELVELDLIVRQGDGYALSPDFI